MNLLLLSLVFSHCSNQIIAFKVNLYKQSAVRLCDGFGKPVQQSLEGENHFVSNLRQELSDLEYLVQVFEALRQRNKAQLGSFIDEAHQWRSMPQFERDILTNSTVVIERIERIEEALAKEIQSNEIS